MDVRIGVTQAARELLAELPDDTDREALKGAIGQALSGAVDVFTLINRRGREIMVPSAKIAYVEVGASEGERRMGFEDDLTGPLGRSLLERRLLFVTGKGGVGKTTVAAALAVHAASAGASVMVCEVDAKGTLAAAFEVDELTFAARTVHPGVAAMAMNTEDSLRESLRLYLKVPLLARIGPLARTLDFVADAAPGVKEILTVGKLCYEVRERHYDLVVVDAAATGHVVGQLSAPWAINELVQVGLIRDQTKWMTDILADPVQTGVLVVTTPEELPVLETIDLLERLGDAVPVAPAGVVVNRVLPELFTRDDEEVFTRLHEPDAVAALAGQLGEGGRRRTAGARATDMADVTKVLDAAALAVALRRERSSSQELLQAKLPKDLPLVLVPELFARSQGKRAIMQVAAALAEELG